MTQGKDQGSITLNRGVKASPSGVQTFIAHCVKTNIRLAQKGQTSDKMVPVVWGSAGIAKTAMFKQLEKIGLNFGSEEKPKIVYPKVIHVALAQIEEAGDLTGLPVVNANEDGHAITDYAPPKWWPTKEDATGPNGEERPVILLIDDFNRADPRILKAIMQLLQDYGTNTRQLPASTTIGLTGNPPSGDDGAEYMSNEIDKAILTRMEHITMKFDKTDWGLWAERNGIDKRVQSFVFRYPEMCDGTVGERTNPRSIAKFARMIEDIKDLKAEQGLVTALINSCLDESVAVAFEKFVFGDLQMIVEPEEILSSWATAEKKLDKLVKRGGKKGSGVLRSDIVGIITDRLYVYLMNPDSKVGKKEFQGFVNFVERSDLLPEDGMYTLLRRLRRDATSPALVTRVRDLIKHGGPVIADKIISIS